MASPHHAVKKVPNFAISRSSKRDEPRQSLRNLNKSCQFFPLRLARLASSAIRHLP
jgi:hypothetical protein